ncbi:hypothetical protein P4V43_18425 [Brevibacillus fortis]|nr:hypothetical protein [Brevibacillus fortis]
MIQPVCVLSHVLHYENGTLKEVEDSIVIESPIMQSGIHRIGSSSGAGA